MPDISRRDFFKSLIAGAVATAVLRAYEPDKYDRSLATARNIALNTQVLKTISLAYPKKADRPEFQAVQSDAQKLFTIFNEEFECVKSPEVVALVRGILTGENRLYTGLIYDHSNERIARSILETVFVVTMSRDLIRHQGAPFVTKMIPAFSAFAGTYKSVIVM